MSEGSHHINLSRQVFQVSKSMVNVAASNNTANKVNGMRPVNLQTDLKALADLIELVFADTMDSSGRAALREMRAMSRLGPGLRLLRQVNEMALGVSMGYVWLEEGRIVGNVSVYPAHLPAIYGPTYIIANVGVHPNYRGRGIARHLMQASMGMIRERGGRHVVLQVDDDNHRARPLYRSLGFVDERVFTTWRRRSTLPIPERNPDYPTPYIRRRRRSEWKQEYQLAYKLRPNERGGLGWLRPLHVSQFRRSVWRSFLDAINMRGFERLVVPHPQTGEVAASLWAETALGTSTKLTLLTEPAYQGIYDEVLLNNIVRRPGMGTITCEHPTDDEATNKLLRRYHFMPQRTVVHMRWDVR